tara:strand:+ start:3689 stop:5140 length:1452 start_codon:yes stop_codon:yes gene_type:complete
MPAQDEEVIPEGFRREWVDDVSQRQDDAGNLVWEKQLARDRKKGIPATPILNFPGGGYWKYINTSAPNEPPVKYAVPEIFTDHLTGEDYRGNRQTKTSVPAIEKKIKFGREHLDRIIKLDNERKFDEYMAEMEESSDEEPDFTKQSRFQGDSGFAKDASINTMASSIPQGHYYQRDADGNDIWKDGRRLKATLAEGQGITRPGKVAAHLRPYGRGGMYGGEEQILKKLEETNITNINYISDIASRFAPFKEEWVIPSQTPEGEEDRERSDKTKLTRDWTKQNIDSINPEDFYMPNPDKYWRQSSEGKAAIREAQIEFDRWADDDYSNSAKQLAGGPFDGKALHWKRDLGIGYGATGADWDAAKAKKEQMWKMWSAENKANTHKGLDIPGSRIVGEKVIAPGGVVVDSLARPTGEVVALDDPVPEDEPEQVFDDSDDEVDDFFGSDEDVEGELGEDEDEAFEDDKAIYGRSQTSGTGKQLKWGN